MTAAEGQGAVAAGDPATAAAAAEVLAAGGSACDAALAGMLAACVTEPVLCSLGAGGFLLSMPADGDDARLFDFFAETPAEKGPAEARDFRRITADFGTATQDFHIGRAAAAVPGVPAGLFAVHAARGRLPMVDVMAPAIRMARAGHPIGAFQAHLMQVVHPIVLATDAARALMADPKDPRRPRATGTIRRLPGFADTLEAMAAEGPRYFYEGPPARAVAAAAGEGGLLTVEDFRRYQTITRRPIAVAAAGGRLVTAGAPSLGGALIAAQLAAYDRLDVPPDDPAAQALAVAGTMAAAVAERDTAGLDQAEDPSEVAAATERLLAEDGLATLTGRARKIGGTTHLSVIDANGDLAALSVSNGEGNGEIIPGTDQMMNNMLGEEDLNPRGFFEWAPATRIASMMAPCALLGVDGGRTALGTGGSNRIRSAIFHVLARLLGEGLSLAAAVAAPRLHVEGTRLEIEGGVDTPVARALIARFPDHRLWPDRNVFFGGVNAVARDGDGTFHAAGDPRRGGAGLVVAR